MMITNFRKGGYTVDINEKSELESSLDSQNAEETADDILKEAVDDGEFYAVPNASGNLIWSLLALLCAVTSVVLFAFFYIGGIISAVAAIALAVLSSRKLGFFDRMALIGLIFGIFGLVFGIFSMIADLTGILDGINIA